MLHKGETRAGKGGDVTLGGRAGSGRRHGALALAGQLRGYGMAGGGSLTLETDGKVVIGGADALANRPTHTPTGAAQPQPLLLDPSLLRAGFANTTSTAVTACAWPRGATLDVAMPVYRYEPGSEATGQRPAPRCCWRRCQENPLGRADAARRRDLTLRSQRIEMARTSISALARGVGRSWPRDPPWAAATAVSPWMAARARRSHRVGYRRAGLRRARQPRDQDAQPRHLDRRRGDAGRRRRPPVAWTLTVAARPGAGRRQHPAGGALDWDATGIADSARDIAIVVRPGAVLDASARAWPSTRRAAAARGRWTWGDGGQIVLKSSYGLFLDGDMRARAGGAGAAGGTLALALETPTFPLSVNAEDGVRRPRELILSQGTQASGLASDLAGAARSGAASVRRLSARQFEAGGFGNLSLLVNGILSFDGDVALAASQSLRLCRQLFRDRPRGGGTASACPRHTRLAGAARAGDGVTPTVTWRDGASARPGVGSFTADADLIDIRDRVGFGARGAVPLLAGAPVTVDRRGFDQVSLNSRGDVRLLGGQAGRGLSGDATTELGTNGDLRITSAQLYPATGASATIWGGYETGRRLEILRQPGTKSVAPPLSVFGSLSLGADTVIQAGTVRAPMGSISLGQDARGSDSWRARSVELMPGSLTSVSGAGVMVPMAARRMA